MIIIYLIFLVSILFFQTFIFSNFYFFKLLFFKLLFFKLLFFSNFILSSNYKYNYTDFKPNFNQIMKKNFSSMKNECYTALY